MYRGVVSAAAARSSWLIVRTRRQYRTIHAAVYAFARALVLDRGAVDDTVVQRTRDAGLTDVDLLQLVTECVFAGLVGLVDNLAGHVELDEFLQPRAWNERGVYDA